MAVMAIDTGDSREAGANSDFYDGMMGTPVVFSFTGVTDGLIFNCGFGAQWVGWENTSGTPYGGSVQTVAAILAGDRVTMSVPAGGPFAGDLWVFYRRGRGDARGSTGGTTITPTGVKELSRRAQKLRLIPWTCTAMSLPQTFTTNVVGVFHLLTRALSTDANAFDLRFSSDGNHGLGKPAVGASSANRTGRAVFLAAQYTY